MLCIYVVHVKVGEIVFYSDTKGRKKQISAHALDISNESLFSIPELFQVSLLGTL